MTPDVVVLSEENTLKVQRLLSILVENSMISLKILENTEY